MPKSHPFYPNQAVSYGSLYFFLKAKTMSINPFDKAAIRDAKVLILKEARQASPDYRMFIKAATMATGLSERTIKKLLYTKET